MTRGVRDSAALLEHTNGMAASGPYPVLNGTGYVAALSVPPPPLRIAVSMGEALTDSYLTLYLGHLAADLTWVSQQNGVPVHTLDIEPSTRAIGRLGTKLSARDYELAKRYWHMAAEQLMGLLAIPGLPSLALKAGMLKQTPSSERRIPS